MEEKIDYEQLQDELRKDWEDLEYAHLWLNGSTWTEDINLNEQLLAARLKARSYLELVERLSWMLRRN
ncbi:MAG: hypothetical protein ABIQ44_01590 [Chloroflexia bacterium]